MANYHDLVQQIRAKDTNGVFAGVDDKTLALKWKAQFPGKFDSYTMDEGSQPASPAKAPVKSYDTPLTPQEETKYKAWKAKYAKDDTGEDYDLRGAFKEGLTPDPSTGHWPDTYKKPNHKTFSVESKYAKDAPDKAGSWDGDTFIPPKPAGKDLTPMTGSQATQTNSTAGSMYNPLNFLRGIPAGALTGTGKVVSDFEGLTKRLLPHAMEGYQPHMGRSIADLGEAIMPPNATGAGNLGKTVGEIAPNVIPAMKGVQAGRMVLGAPTVARSVAAAAAGQGAVQALRTVGSNEVAGPNPDNPNPLVEGVKAAAAGAVTEGTGNMPMAVRAPIAAAMGAAMAPEGERLKGAGVQGALSAIMGKQSIPVSGGPASAATPPAKTGLPPRRIGFSRVDKPVEAGAGAGATPAEPPAADPNPGLKQGPTTGAFSHRPNNPVPPPALDMKNRYAGQIPASDMVPGGGVTISTPSQIRRDVGIPEPRPVVPGRGGQPKPVPPPVPEKPMLDEAGMEAAFAGKPTQPPPTLPPPAKSAAESAQVFENAPPKSAAESAKVLASTPFKPQPWQRGDAVGKSAKESAKVFEDTPPPPAVAKTLSTSPIFQPIKPRETAVPDSYPITKSAKESAKTLKKAPSITRTPEGVIIEELSTPAEDVPVSTADDKAAGGKGKKKVGTKPIPQGFSVGGGEGEGATGGSTGMLGSQKLDATARKLWNYVRPGERGQFMDDPDYTQTFDEASTAKAEAEANRPGKADAIFNRLLSNPTQKWVSTIRPVQRLQDKIDAANPTVTPTPSGTITTPRKSQPSDRLLNVFDRALASDDIAEQHLEHNLTPILEKHLKGLDYDSARSAKDNAAVYAQALQKRDVEVNQYGKAAWEANTTGPKANPKLQAIQKAAEDGDQTAQGQRSAEIRSMGEGIYTDRLNAGDAGTHYQEPLSRIENQITQGEKYHGWIVKDVQKYNRDILDKMTDSGLISTQLNAALKRMYPNYVPVNRIYDAIQGDNPWAATDPIGHLTKQRTVKKLGGSSELPIEDMWKSTVDKTFSAHREMGKNQVGQNLERIASTHPGWDDYVRVVEPHEISKDLFKPTDQNSITYLVNGNKRVLEVDPDIAVAARHMTPKQLDGFVSAMRLSARVLRSTATGSLSPVFQAGNVVKDVWSNANNTGLLTLKNLPKAAWQVSRGKGKDFDELRSQGGGFTINEAFRNNPRMQVDNELIKMQTGGKGVVARAKYALGSKEGFKNSAENAVMRWENLAGKSEQVGRTTVFMTARDAALKKGMSKQEANIAGLEAANNQMANYRHVGSNMRTTSAVVPYMNAAIQGMASTVDAVKRSPGKFAATTTATVVMPSIAATVWNLSDPARQKAYFDIPDYDKDGSITFVSGANAENGKHSSFKIPLQQPFDGINKLTRMAVEKLWREHPEKFQQLAEEVGIGGKVNFYPAVDKKYDTPTDALHVAKAVAGTVSPFNSPWDVVPQAGKVLTDVVSGVHQFSGRPFVPKSEQGKPKIFQEGVNQSRVIKKGAQALGMSPAYTQGAIESVGGQGIPLILNTADKAGQAVGLLPQGKAGGTDFLAQLKSRFTQSAGGRMAQVDREETAGKQEKAYQGLQDNISSPTAQLLSNNKISIQPVVPLASDSENTISSRHQLKGLLTDHVVTRTTNDPRFAKLTPEEKRKVLEFQLRKVNTYLGALTRASKGLDPVKRDKFWQDKVAKNTGTTGTTVTPAP